MDTPSWDSLQPAPPSAEPQQAPDWNNLSAKPPEGAAPSWDSLSTENPAEEKYSGLGQEILTGVEGAGQGFAGPVATGVEMGLSKLGVPGLTPEDIAGRKAAHPYIHGAGEIAGLGAGLYTGVGELGLLAKGVNAIPLLGRISQAGTMGKIGAAAIKGAIETGLIQGGDEISKAMLGQGDPEAPVASALSNMGYASLMGAAGGGLFGTIGAGLGRLGESGFGRKMGQFAEDFGKKWKSPEAEELVEAVKNELNDYHGSTTDYNGEVWGSNGLKAQAVEKLAPEITQQQLQNHVAEVRKIIQDAPEELRRNRLFRGAVKAWEEASVPTTDASGMMTKSPSAQDVFNASNLFKRQVQDWGKFNKAFLNPREAAFVNAAKGVSHDLRTSLENTNHWGKLGELQKNINKAFSDFKPANDDFVSKFTSKELGERVVDPGKINTYIKQLGKPNAEMKQTWLGNYIDAAEKYRSRIAELHEALGVENPIVPSSLNYTKGTLGEITNGAKFADYLRTKFPGRIGQAVGEGGGAAVGGTTGFLIGKELAPYLSNAIGKPITKMGGHALLKVLESGGYKSTAEAMAHASHVERGAQKINSSLDKLLRGGGQKVYDNYATEKNREKVKKFIDQGGLNRQIENQLNHEAKKPKSFAEGGYVEADVKDDPTLGTVYPEQHTLMESAKSRIYNYLNSVKPQENPSKLPFDESPDSRLQEKSYHKAIDIANEPLSILNSVKDGSITPEELKHFSSMYPEVHNHLAKEITKRISTHILDEEQKPSRNTRQGLSMFLGAPMDSSYTPAGIQAAQSVYMKQKAAAQQAPTKVKKGTSKLNEMSKQFQTPQQSAQARHEG